jgi:signal peptidase I
MNKRHPFLAALASLAVPGLGQLYNGAPRKAAIFYGLGLLEALLVLLLPPTHGFTNFVIWVVAGLVVLAAAVVDAVRGARSPGQIERRPYQRWWAYMAFIVFHWFLVCPGMNYLLGVGDLDIFSVPTESMSPTVMAGDKILVDRRAYAASQPRRGDIVIFTNPRNPKELYFKRVLGLPGESIEFKGMGVRVNGAILKDPWGSYITGGDSFPDSVSMTLGSEKYCVVGDNRDNSLDSRSFGPIARDKIVAKVLFVLWARDHGRIGTQFIQ